MDNFLVLSRRRFLHGAVSVVKFGDEERPYEVTIRSETDALSRVGTLIARPGETLRVEMFSPPYMSVFGGLVQGLIPGCFCAGDEVIAGVLDGELRLASELRPDEFRLMAVKVQPDGLDIGYGRPFFHGQEIADGRTVVFYKHLAFAPGGEREFVVEVLDQSGDASQILAVRLSEGAVKVDDGVTSVACPRGEMGA